MTSKDIRKIYVKELDEISEDILLEKLGGDNELLEEFKHNLYRYDFISYNPFNSSFYFAYVGIIIFADLVIYVYPKYISTTDDSLIERDFKQVLKVIMKYDKKYEFSYESDDSDNVPFNRLPLSIFFLEDYYENGLYYKNQDKLEINGNGEIDWDKTINDSFAIIDSTDYIPYYTQLVTKNKINEINSYFRLLHECIITDCSNFLEHNGLLELFDLTPIELTEKTIDENFNDYKLVENKIKRELNVEFNTHKQKLLKLMYSYVSQKNSFTQEHPLTVYGLHKYEHIWEDVCQQVLDDKLHKKLNSLNLPKALDEKYRSDEYVILKDIIKKPEWNLHNSFNIDIEENEEISIEKSTLIPDIVTFDEENDEKNEFIILDAKYYDLNLEKVNSKYKLYNQPGMESITKQYMYELAFREFKEKHGFDGVKNAFLVPVDSNIVNKIHNMGYVKLDFIKRLQHIQVIQLPASLMYDYYLKNEVMDLSKLKLN